MMIFWMFLNFSTFIVFAVFMFSLIWTLIAEPKKKSWNIVLISGITWFLLFIIICFMMFSTI